MLFSKIRTISFFAVGFFSISRAVVADAPQPISDPLLKNYNEYGLEHKNSANSFVPGNIIKLEGDSHVQMVRENGKTWGEPHDLLTVGNETLKCTVELNEKVSKASHNVTIKAESGNTAKRESFPYRLLKIKKISYEYGGELVKPEKANNAFHEYIKIEVEDLRVNKISSILCQHDTSKEKLESSRLSIDHESIEALFPGMKARILTADPNYWSEQADTTKASKNPHSGDI